MKHQVIRYSLTATAQFDIDPYPRVHAVVFNHIAQARHWLMLMTADEAMVIHKRHMRLLISGIKVESSQLLEIMTYAIKPGDPTLDDLHYKLLLQFRRARWHERPAEQRVMSNAPSSPAVVKPQRPERPEEYITVTALVAGSDLSPMQARGILRLTETKPAYGWAWPPKELPRIKKILGLR
jgi:hypothetical protein